MQIFSAILYYAFVYIFYTILYFFFQRFSFICYVEMKKSCNKFMQQYSYVKKAYNKPWEVGNVVIGQVDWGLMVDFTLLNILMALHHSIDL